MGRRFTKASSELIQWVVTGKDFTNWGFGTLAAYIRKVSNDAGNYQYLLCNNNSANNDTGFGWSLDPTDHINLWSTTGANDRTSTSTFVVADGWGIIAITKATGGTPRAHFYKQSANTWTHENTGGTQANNTSINATPKVTLGAFSHASNGDYFDGDVAAVMALNSWNMTDSEIERLPSGNWQQYVNNAFGPTFLAEFPSGNDPIVAGAGTSAVSVGRERFRSSTVTGTSRTATNDPPGFRFSPDVLRR